MAVGAVGTVTTTERTLLIRQHVTAHPCRVNTLHGKIILGFCLTHTNKSNSGACGLRPLCRCINMQMYKLDRAGFVHAHKEGVGSFSQLVSMQQMFPVQEFLGVFSIATLHNISFWQNKPAFETAAMWPYFNVFSCCWKHTSLYYTCSHQCLISQSHNSSSLHQVKKCAKDQANC